MATPYTTYADIRSQIVSTVEALTPDSLTAAPFRLTKTEQSSFRGHAEECVSGILREFEVRFESSSEPGGTDGEVIYTDAACELVVAYPNHWNDYSHAGAVATRLNREAMIAIALEDRRTLIRAIAKAGGVNQLSGHHGSIDGAATIERGDGVSFLVVPLTVTYWQVGPDTVPVVIPREITPVTLIGGEHSTSNTTSDYVSSIGAPTANYWNLLAVITADSQNGSLTPTGVTGAGLTWETVGTAIVIGVGSTSLNLSLWRALGPSPSAGALTIAYGGSLRTSISYIWAEFGGVDTGGTNGSGAVLQQDTDTQTGGGDPSVSLAAFEDATNLMVVVAGSNVTSLAVDGDFTDLHDVSGTAPTSRIWMQYALNQTTNDAVASAGAAGLWSLELKSA